MPNYILTNSKACAPVVLLLSLAAAALGCIFLRCSHPEQGWAPEALHLHLPSPHHMVTLQTTRQGGGRTLWRTLVSATLGNGGVGCRSTKSLSTAAEMGGAARRERERYAPAGSLPAAPASAQ